MFIDTDTLYIIVGAVVGVCCAPIINPLVDLVGDVIEGAVGFISR